MKNKSYLITLVAAIVVVMAIFGFTTDKPEATGGIATMRVSEGMSGQTDNSISIVYEDGKVEDIELVRLHPGHMSENLVLINENLNKVRAKGYKLISTAAGGPDGYIITTYTFEKQ